MLLPELLLLTPFFLRDIPADYEILGLVLPYSVELFFTEAVLVFLNPVLTRGGYLIFLESGNLTLSE